MRQILRDEIQLARTLQLQQLRFAHQIVQRERAMFAAHERNRTKRAAVIAPFADFQIPHVCVTTTKHADTRMFHN